MSAAPPVVYLARVNKGWSAQTLATEADVPLSFVYRLERRGMKRPSVDALARVAGALGIAASDIANDLAGVTVLHHDPADPQNRKDAA